MYLGLRPESILRLLRVGSLVKNVDLLTRLAVCVCDMIIGRQYFHLQNDFGYSVMSLVSAVNFFALM